MSDLLRVATAGSVDDGKSTLIGRLLHDSKNVFADQFDAVEAASKRRGLDAADLALLTDGLRAEREQGITIDVAYRYFATPRRTFVLADTPGHVQYTRNMVTGASTADVAVVLVDARHGLVEQSHRHAAVAALLGVGHVVLAVNKMDLVDFSEEVYDRIVADFDVLASELGIRSVTAIPVSALHGDNVVEPSSHLSWYAGQTLLDHLETVPVPPRGGAVGARLPVQLVIRPRSAEHPDYRAYAGRVAAGTLRVGDEVVVLPSGRVSTVAGIDTHDGSLSEASTGRSVSVRLADDVDVSRGDLLAAAADAPSPVRQLTGRVCVLAERQIRAGDRFRLRAGTREVRAIVGAVADRLDVTTLKREDTDALGLNDIGDVTLKLAEPVAVDPYAMSRGTGSFLLIDESSGATVAAGMVEQPAAV
ncbi:sulfate adenylyltransferase subunit 1 [Cryptosporangium phraense]|uniref:sulfate adenylyltransferase n=1 Tax=Cryptosporangium phraense TaxID=2593070 RepID=A0A545AJT2_9ACTN|nr:GTP-binding protein [Cryptosporangium phraense]TQS41573.1 sulfate adenylyltransferase [Cryptosporangium phraense]